MTKIVNSRYNRHTIYSMLEVFMHEKIKTLKLKILKKEIKEESKSHLIEDDINTRKGFLVNLLLHIEQLMQYYLF